MVLSFQTKRLQIVEIENTFSVTERKRLIEQVPDILTPSVVKNLPPYFHDIDSTALAEQWLTRMQSESRLLQVKSELEETIGFLFAYVENDTIAHIGYLLAEQHWGKGIASELLQGFIQTVSTSESWVKLIAGVEHSNYASIHLLNKLGFSKQLHSESGVVFFEYRVSRAE
ncbi:GNAT family N-acetyltransferase [Pseudoalteromonas sp. T1lg65]|uniref:GNAT family N-acetyltransferase n=1 Tax=Pseudoalteromonas sp. T1lg65 TaxID=2077101 RepID=UPI003F79EF06